MPVSDRRLAAVMFTDLVGFTALTQGNEALAMDVLERHNKLLRPFFQRFHGIEIKTIGDSFLVEFESALNAIECAVDVQSHLHDYNLDSRDDWKIRLRIGIHLGDVVHKEGDIFGDAVNISSRIEPIADPEGICVSEQVYYQVSNKFEYPLAALGEKALQGVARPVEVYKVVMPWDAKSSPASFDRHRIAVLPFVNMSPNLDEEYFADGMTEELISAVSNIGELSVISRTSAMKFKGGGKTVTEIGGELKVGTLLEGSVRRSDDRVRVTAQLIDVNSDKHLWSQNYDRRLQDVFAVQSEIAQRVADALKIKLITGDRVKVEDRQTSDTAAYGLYLQARYQLSKRTVEAVRKANDLFKKAVELDPKYALAYAGLADSYILMAGDDLSDVEAAAKAKGFAMKALEYNDSLAEAHAALAFAIRMDWDWKGAEDEFKKAIELNPNYSTAHHWYSLLLEILGRFDEALKEVNLAEEIDPLSLIIGAAKVRILRTSGKYDLAIEKARKMFELEPNFMVTHIVLASTYAAMKEYGKAAEEARIACRLDPEDIWDRGALLFYEFKLGVKSRADVEQLLNEMRELSKRHFVSPLLISTFYELLGDEDQMFGWIEKAFDQHDMNVALLNIDPEFEQRSNPRYTALVKKMGLTPQAPPSKT